jgi:DNA transformation protein
MTIEPQLQRQALALLSPFGEAYGRAMFGGAGAWLDGLMVILIARGRLYWRTDSETLPAFAAAGGEPFTYTGKSRPVTMPYWTLPDAALATPDQNRAWVKMARSAAAAAAAKKKPRRVTLMQNGNEGAIS